MDLHTYSENCTLSKIYREIGAYDQVLVELKELLDMEKSLTQASQHRALSLER